MPPFTGYELFVLLFKKSFFAEGVDPQKIAIFIGKFWFRRITATKAGRRRKGHCL
jgi:hypothetical protein